MHEPIPDDPPSIPAVPEFPTELPDDETPPISDEQVAKCQDFDYLVRLRERGELRQYSGEHVLAYRLQVAGHGVDIVAIRDELAARFGVPFERIVSVFVHPR